MCLDLVFRDTSSYHRCGRTDKGVSAMGQVSETGVFVVSAHCSSAIIIVSKGT